MPLILKLLKNIRIEKAIIIASFSVGLTTSIAHGFNPLDLKKEFDEKLTAQQLLASTRYYALGERFKTGQKWDEKKFTDSLKKNTFRIRSDQQMILAEDAIFFTETNCLSQLDPEFSTEHTIGSSDLPITCWKWQNKKSGAQLVVLQNGLILATYARNPLIKSAEAAFDPILVAQYKNNEPLIQDEKKLSDIPVMCLNAVMAIEDNDFLDHSGLSYTGLARAILKNITTFKKAQGGSTITQQLVKNYFLTPEKSFTRKAKEIYMAIRLESQWTKDEILETYLNIIYMGQSGVFQVRGFPAASQFYFQKSIDKLNLPECALLSAIINNPLQNNPWKNKDKATARRNLVLKKMLELNLISDSDHKIALTYPLPTANTVRSSETAPYFFEAARNEAKDLGISIEGKSLYTNLDLDLQSVAQQSLSDGISKVTYSKEKLKTQKINGLELQGAILSTENQTGKVNVFVGGQNYKTTQYNRALNSRRQIGSLIKPFIYLSGLIYGDFKPTTIIQDEPFTWTYDKKNWKPDNYDRKFRGPVPYYYALKESLNSPTAQVAYKTQLSNIVPVLKKAGFESDIPMIPAISLGASEHTPFEVLQAYQTLARLGSYKKLSFLNRIEDETGSIIFDEATENQLMPEQVLDQNKLAVLLGMMKQTLQTGTAKSLSSLPFSTISAGKTGTTTQGRDVWFSGFTPNITTVVWIGFDQNLPTSLTGASGAVPIWSNYMKTATSHYGLEDFKWPKGVHAEDIEFKDVKETVKLILE